MTDGQLELVLTALGAPSLLLAVIAFFGKSIVRHLLDKDIKTFEEKLKGAADEKMAALTHGLEVAKLEHQVRFSKLHEQRANTIAEVFKLMTYVYVSSAKYASSVGFDGDLPKPEQLKVAWKYAQDFHSYYEINRIWMPAAICDQIDSFTGDIGSVLGRLSIYERFPNMENMPAHFQKEHAEAWFKASEAFRSRIPEAKGLLEAEFRRILGDSLSVPDHPAPSP